MDSLTKDITSRNRIVSEIDKNFFVEAGAGYGKSFNVTAPTDT